MRNLSKTESVSIQGACTEMKKQFRRNGKRIPRRLAKRFTSLVSMLVVFTTTYMMILPAIAIDNQAAAASPGIYADLQEIDAESVGAESVGAVPADAELSAEEQAVPVLACPFAAHHHTDDCYIEKDILDSEGLPTGEKEKILVCGQASFSIRCVAILQNCRSISPRLLNNPRNTTNIY